MTNPSDPAGERVPRRAERCQGGPGTWRAATRAGHAGSCVCGGGGRLPARPAAGASQPPADSAVLAAAGARRAGDLHPPHPAVSSQLWAHKEWQLVGYIKAGEPQPPQKNLLELLVFSFPPSLHVIQLPHNRGAEDKPRARWLPAAASSSSSCPGWSPPRTAHPAARSGLPPRGWTWVRGRAGPCSRGLGKRRVGTRRAGTLPWGDAAGRAAGASPGSLCFAVKQEGLRFVEQELQNITVSDLHGKEGQFHYNISQVKVMDLQLAFSDLHFQPQQHLVFNISNASISLRFRRQLLYWFFYDIGSINASADGVHIHTVLQLAKDEAGRLKISNITCNASIARMHAGFSGTLRKVYEFLSTFIVTGMRFLLSQQICPSLEHASLVLLNSVLDTVPVRNYVDEHIGIDYSLLRDPAVSADTLDLDFKGMFFPRTRENQELENHAVEPVIKETERMVYVAFSEYFFDSAMHAYFQAGVLAIELEGEKVPKDLEVLLRATFFGTIFMLSPAVDAPLRLVLQVSAPPRCIIKPSGTSVSVSAFLNISLVPPGRPAVQLSSVAMETKLSARVFLQGKALRVQLDLRRFRIYSKQSALESLALFSLQGPLKTLLQLTIMPLINERTKKGVQIPLPEGMDFTREVVTNHAGFLTVGADLHFSKGLREVIEKYRPGPTAPASPSPWPTEPSAAPHPL
uniref:Phospholipid transfer protein n=1 Tax=Otus sunia TaxID=257818 RepID=A0A8C8E577_9STRI